MLCTPRARRSRKASFRAAAWLCCARLRLLARPQAGRRREDRRRHRAPRLRRAGAPDRRQRRLGRRDRDREDPANKDPITASTLPRAGTKTGEGRRHRSDQGHRSALQNAASISALMPTTEAMICEIPEKKPGSDARRRGSRRRDRTFKQSSLLSKKKKRGRSTRGGLFYALNTDPYMVIWLCMKTTVEIQDELLIEAKEACGRAQDHRARAHRERSAS